MELFWKKKEKHIENIKKSSTIYQHFWKIL